MKRIILLLTLSIFLGGCAAGMGQYPGSAYGPYSQSYALPTLGLTAAGAAIGYNMGDDDNRAQSAILGGILGAIAGTVAEQATYAYQQDQGYYGQPTYQQPAYQQQPAYYPQPAYYQEQSYYPQPVYYQQPQQQRRGHRQGYRHQNGYYGPRRGYSNSDEYYVRQQPLGYDGRPIRGFYGQPYTRPY